MGGDLRGAHREFSRTECVGYRPGYRDDARTSVKAHRLLFSRYRFRWAGPIIPARSANGKSHDGPHRRFGRRARYLPDDPDVHRLVRSEDSKYRVIRPPAAVPAVRRPDPFPSPLPCLPFGVLTAGWRAAAPAFGAFAACFLAVAGTLIALNKNFSAIVQVLFSDLFVLQFETFSYLCAPAFVRETDYNKLN